METSLLQFQREHISETWDEASALIQAHHEEVGALSREEFQPDREKYEAFENVGAVHLFTARARGELAGYSIFTVIPSHRYYPRLSFAEQDILYLAPKYRGLEAMRFIRWVDVQLQAQGIQVAIRHVSVRKDYGPLLERLDYIPAERTFLRML